MRRVVNVLGVPVDDVTMSEAIDRLADLVAAGRASNRTHQVATVNVDFVVRALHDPRLLDLLQGAALSLPDGMPIVWGSWILGTRLRERVAGVDVVEALAERAAAVGFRMYLFGSGPGIAEKAADVLVERFPSLQIVADSGPIVAADGTMDVEHLQRIRATRPDIVCVALGNPKQEFWIGHYGGEIGAPVLIGVGGSLDFIAGRKRRAPLWMQRAGLEWVFRAGTEPRRLVKRYAADIESFVPSLAKQAWVGRRRTTTSGSVAVTDRAGGVVELTGAPRLDDLREPVPSIEVVDLAGFAPPDNSTTDFLMSLGVDARRRGRRLAVRAADVRVRQRLSDLGVNGLFRHELAVAPGCAAGDRMAETQ